MNNVLLKAAVRARFGLTSRNRASVHSRKYCNYYLKLAKMINAKSGALSILVPRMIGIDEDMRHWSFFMILEHNTIVNRTITSIVDSLVKREKPEGPGAIDPKKDVMPSRNPGEEQIQYFRSSVEEHLNVVSKIRRLRWSHRKQHPIFGEFDAHYWHCMFSFHLLIHLKQAEYVAQKAYAEQVRNSFPLYPTT
jgi:hypothetical protein